MLLLMIFIHQFYFISPSCTKYVPCDPGYFLDAQACICRPCPAGEYNGDKDGSCKNCSPGTYSESSGSGYCEDCPVNTYNPNYGSKSRESCIPCEEGLISILGSGRCVEESMRCKLFSRNYYCTSCDSEDHTKCAGCEKGYYLKNGECNYCGLNCKKCSERDNCLECEENYIFDTKTKQCVDEDELDDLNNAISFNLNILLLMIITIALI